MHQDRLIEISFMLQAQYTMTRATPQTTTRRSFPIATLIVVLLVVLPPANAQSDAAIPIGQIDNARLSELSGLVGAENKTYWGINDSGNPPALFLFDSSGKVRKELPVSGATNVDWEAMALDADGRLLIADVGDNRRARKDYVIYVVKVDGPKATAQEAISFHYDDGKSRDCESVFMAGNRLYLVEKTTGNKKADVFAIDWRERQDGKATVANRISTLDLASPITDIAYSPEREELAVLTYLGVVLFHFSDESDFGRPPFQVLPGIYGQCEALWYLGSESLIITNEPGMIWRLELLPKKSTEKTTSDEP